MPETIEGIEAEIDKVISKGGPMTHNLCGLLLNKLSKLDKERADDLYNELCSSGIL